MESWGDARYHGRARPDLKLASRPSPGQEDFGADSSSMRGMEMSRSYGFVLLLALALAGCQFSASASGEAKSSGDASGDASASMTQEQEAPPPKPPAPQGPIKFREGKLDYEGVINFEYDKAELRKDEETTKTLAEFKTFLDQHPDVKIEIEGHTDSRGSDDYTATCPTGVRQRAQVADRERRGRSQGHLRG